MAHTSTTYDALLTAIDAKIEALVNNPEVNWREGNISVNSGDKIKQLMDLREKVIGWYEALPAEAIVTRQNLISEFGEDATEYLHEEV